LDIGEKIKARRIELGLTLEDVAKLLGVSKSTVLKYETNYIKNMGLDKFEALANALQVKPSYLLGFGGKPVPETPEQAAVMVDKELQELMDMINQMSPADRTLALGLATDMIKRLSRRE
jgi:transcriptional regulator with XRE-family HTH domain